MFQLCVLGYAYVSGLCFGHGFQFLFRAVIFLLSFFFFFFTSFDGHNGVVVVQ